MFCRGLQRIRRVGGEMREERGECERGKGERKPSNDAVAQMGVLDLKVLSRSRWRQHTMLLNAMEHGPHWFSN